MTDRSQQTVKLLHNSSEYCNAYHTNLQLLHVIIEINQMITINFNQR